MIEVWKDVDWSSGAYQISSLGRVRSVDRIDCAGRRLKGKVMKAFHNHAGYVSIILCENGKPITCYVHRLVANAFIEKSNHKNHVNHKDGNKWNNEVNNLEWCDRSYNMKHAYTIGLAKPIGRKLSDEDVNEIMKQKGVKSSLKLAKQYGVSFQLICKIWKGGYRCSTVIPA